MPTDRKHVEMWFDPIQGLNDDNTCAGCHSPTNGFGDTQPIAIGIDNNGVVGPGRAGPRNQRRSPMAINTVFYPALMWNSRFHASSGDPFDNRQGFVFPAPEGTSLSYLPHLLTAQAFILLVATLVILFLTNWQLTLVVLPILPVALVLFMIFGAVSQPLFVQIQIRLSALNTVLQENLAGMKVVKAFAREKQEREEYYCYISLRPLLSL